MEETDECENLMRKALAVEEIPDNFDPNKIPQTGEEYIHHVMYEAKQCKEWVTADISQQKVKKQAKVFVEPTGCVSAPSEFLPSLEWQQKTIADFSAFRLHMQKLKNFNNFSEQIPFNGEIEQWKKKCYREPKLTEILSFNQKNIYKILNFILILLNEIPDCDGMNYNLGIWLYALLSTIELPLMPEYCFILREIARKCSEIRLKLDKTSSEILYKPLNLFICIIGRYFNNYDLIDNVNEI